MSERPSFSGPQRAALFILGLDESVAAEVMRHLKEGELKQLARSAETLSGVPIEALGLVYEDFERAMLVPLLPRSGGEYVRRLAASALGEEKAEEVFVREDRIAPLETIRAARSTTLAELLQEEQPQVAAVIISQLPRDQAAKVMQAMPPESQVDLLARVAGLKEVPAQALQMASEALARTLVAAGGLGDSSERRNFDGCAFAAGILNELQAGDSERIMGGLQESHGALAPKIREAMFTFEDLGRLDLKSLQLLMREVQSEQLLIALKTASESLRNHFLSAVSSRAADAMRDDLSMMPPTRLSDVEKAQREIVETAMRLSSEGRLVMPGSSSEKLV